MWKLSEDERKFFGADDLKSYDRAVRLKSSEDACGPFGGWADGNDILISLGWKRVERKSDHRVYVSLEKPVIILNQKG